MSNKQLMIWFDDKGNLLDEAGKHADMQRQVAQGYFTGKSEEAKDFDDQMTLIRVSEYYRRGTRVRFRSVLTGREYSMFVSDFNAVLGAERFVNNEVKGTFHFQKKGSGQSIVLVLPPKTTP